MQRPVYECVAGVWPRVPSKPACRLLLSSVATPTASWTLRVGRRGGGRDHPCRLSRAPPRVYAPPGWPTCRARRRGTSSATPGDPHPPSSVRWTTSCHPVPEFRGASFIPRPGPRRPRMSGARAQVRDLPPNSVYYNNILLLLLLSLLLFLLYFTTVP